MNKNKTGKYCHTKFISDLVVHLTDLTGQKSRESDLVSKQNTKQSYEIELGEWFRQLSPKHFFTKKCECNCENHVITNRPIAKLDARFLQPCVNHCVKENGKIHLDENW